MPESLNGILKSYVDDIHMLYGDRLKAVILYGSYARGDADPDSDVDIMILVELTEQEIREKGRQLSNVTFEYNFDNDLAIMPIVKNADHFNKWLGAYPFYYNVKKEGVELYAA
ncbi:MAG: nucleotidyltransferase domain-containing protein [Lachnospiraceae bacterium]|nr:nucleotidyltransferase domain-containing protein [Lachnospiraceae bacterium]